MGKQGGEEQEDQEEEAEEAEGEEVEEEEEEGKGERKRAAFNVARVAATALFCRTWRVCNYLGDHRWV